MHKNGFKNWWFLIPIAPLLFLCSCKENAVKVFTAAEREIYPDMIGVNGNLTQFTAPWNNDSLVDAMTRLEVANFRYPAGTLGNYWDWDTGWLDTEVPDSLMIDWVVANKLTTSDKKYTLENFAKGQKKLGFTPIFMLNMVSKGLDHSVRNLLKAEKLGMPIHYIELGNELYFNLPYEASVYPTPEDYGKTCKIWIDSLKHHFPDAKYAIIGSYLERDLRHTDWTTRALKHCGNADAVTFHKYSPAGIDGRMEKKNVSAGSEGIADLATVTRKISSNDPIEKQLWEVQLLKKDAAYANFLQTAKSAALTYRKMKVPKGMAIWATEFNMRDDQSALRGTWANAFYTAKYYDEFLKGPIQLTNIHNAIGDLFPQVFSATDQMDHILWKNVRAVPWQLSSQGIPTVLYAKGSKGMNKATQLSFSYNHMLSDDRGNKVNMVSGWLFSSDSRRRLLLVNYSREAILLDLSEIGSFKTTKQFSAPAEAYITKGFQDLAVSSQPFETSLVLAPFSFTLLN